MIGKIGGKEYECLLDTGAMKSIISPEVYLNHPNRNDLVLRECKWNWKWICVERYWWDTS